jgi:hypothetical protein
MYRRSTRRSNRRSSCAKKAPCPKISYKRSCDDSSSDDEDYYTPSTATVCDDYSCSRVVKPEPKVACSSYSCERVPKHAHSNRRYSGRSKCSSGRSSAYVKREIEKRRKEAACQKKAGVAIGATVAPSAGLPFVQAPSSLIAAPFVFPGVYAAKRAIAQPAANAAALAAKAAGKSAADIRNAAEIAAFEILKTNDALFQTVVELAVQAAGSPGNPTSSTLSALSAALRGLPTTPAAAAVAAAATPQSIVGFQGN